MRYYRPVTTVDAVTALASEAQTSRILVGGTDLLVAMRHKAVQPTLLVDIKGVQDLAAPITVEDEWITFGPTATMSDVVAHPGVREWFPALVEAAVLVGSVAIRNRASLIANSANGSPAADTAPPLVALSASVTIASVSGERTVPLREFFLAPRRTLCGPGEMVTSMRVPRPAPGSSSAFERMTRRRGVDLATCSVCAVVDDNGAMTVGLGAVGPTTLQGGPVAPVDMSSQEELERAIDTLLATATPIGDVRAGKPYRTAMIRVLARRALLRAAAQRNDRGLALPDVLGGSSSSTIQADSTTGGKEKPTASDIQSPDSIGSDQVEVTCTVNGQPAEFSVPPHRTLMDALRYQLGLTGTKTCCAEGECGACTVIIDGAGVNSCLMLAAEGEGRDIVTIEGLGAGKPRGMCDLQESFLEAGAVQCGFCIPGQVMAAEYLLQTNPDPSVEEIREAMSGNLCRCAGYQRIVAAVQMTAQKRAGP